MKIQTILKSTIVAFAGASTAQALPPSSGVAWNGCVCDSPVVLVGYDFENVSGTVNSAPPSFELAGFSGGDIAGPGVIMANSVSGNTFGCFSGFNSNGTSGEISFKFGSGSSDDYCLSDITFDFFAEGSSIGNHGPNLFNVAIFGDAGLIWQTEDIVAGIGSANIGSFSLFNQLGGPDALTAGELLIENGESYNVVITAAGANSESFGFDMDNVQVHVCPVPEPSSSLLLLLGSGFFLTRRKK